MLLTIDLNGTGKSCTSLLSSSPPSSFTCSPSYTIPPPDASSFLCRRIVSLFRATTKSTASPWEYTSPASTLRTKKLCPPRIRDP